VGRSVVREHSVLVFQGLVEQRDGPELRRVAPDDCPVQPRDRFDAPSFLQKERIEDADHGLNDLISDGTIGTPLESRHATLEPPIMSRVPLYDLVATTELPRVGQERLDFSGRVLGHPRVRLIPN
jgi:hypothetical protein